MRMLMGNIFSELSTAQCATYAATFISSPLGEIYDWWFETKFCNEILWRNWLMVTFRFLRPELTPCEGAMSLGFRRIQWLYFCSWFMGCRTFVWILEDQTTLLSDQSCSPSVSIIVDQASAQKCTVATTLIVQPRSLSSWLPADFF